MMERPDTELFQADPWLDATLFSAAYTAVICLAWGLRTTFDALSAVGVFALLTVTLGLSKRRRGHFIQLDHERREVRGPTLLQRRVAISLSELDMKRTVGRTLRDVVSGGFGLYSEKGQRIHVSIAMSPKVRDRLFTRLADATHVPPAIGDG